MTTRKVGVWLIGALGSIAGMVIVGAAALRKGLIPPTGMISEVEPFRGLDLLGLDSFRFGGSDVRQGTLLEEARGFARKTRALDPEILREVEDELSEIDRHIRIGTVLNCGDAIQDLAAPAACPHIPLRDEIARISGHFRDFRGANSLDDLIVINLASTEPLLATDERHRTLDAFESCLDRNEAEAVRASTIYAYAAIREGCAYVNFTPSNAALIPAVLELAGRSGVPVMGNDGKTGETLVKSVLAPLFLMRNLEVLSWEGFNILGNMDGAILKNPDNRESKIKTKDRVLAGILGYTPHSGVHINYVPSLDDQKTAWDFIHFRGFLGAKMSLQFIWQGYDSILAAPLVIDLMRFCELALRNGDSGLMPHLSSFFKEPLGVREHRLYEQFQALLNYAEKLGKGSTTPVAPETIEMP